MHTKGHAAPDTTAEIDQARALMERVDHLGEPLEDPLLLYSVLYGVWVANLVMFNGDAIRGLAAHFLALAETQNAAVPHMIGHRLVGASLLYTAEVAEARTHLDQAFSLYDPGKHGALGTRFGYDVGVATLSYRALALWILGYPEAALKDADSAVKDARLRAPQIGNMLVALHPGSWTQIYCGNYIAANAQADETIALAENKGAVSWRAAGGMNKGWVLALTGEPLRAIEMITSGITSFRSNNQTFWLPLFLCCLASANAEIGRHEEALDYLSEATTTLQVTGERWCEADIHRTAGEIALKSPDPDVTKAEAQFELALVIARQQQAKSWELRAAMSKARL
jgi:predicted ATPase